MASIIFNIFLLVSIFYFLFSTKPAYAAELSLGLYPPLLKIQAQPPTTIKAPISIHNLSETSVSLDISIKPFEAKISQEDESFFKNIQLLQEANAIQGLSLGPQQKKDLFVEIVLDRDQPSRDYYFYIQFVSKDNKLEKDTSYSQILGGVALTVLMSIGKEDPNAILEEFSSPSFIYKSSVPFTIKIKNKGNHFIASYGVITIKNVFGKTVGQINLPAANILKDSTKSIEIPWSKSFILGLYKAEINLSLSQKGHMFSKSLSFFALPLRPILVIIILSLVLILILIRVNSRMPK